MRIDLKGKAFYFGIETGNPYNAMRLVLNCLELVGLPFPSAVKILKISAGESTHQVSLIKKRESTTPWAPIVPGLTTEPADYETCAGEAFWRLCGRIAEYEATLIANKNFFEGGWHETGRGTKEGGNRG